MEKDARHALERLKERTTLPASVIPHLENVAARLTPHVPEGNYYLPLHGEHGVQAGYAVFKTVPGPKLVLATIYGPGKLPRGQSLTHLMHEQAGQEAAAKTYGIETDKVAKVLTKLKPHQQRVVDRLGQDDQPGLVAVHGLGSGKTLTSIAAADALGGSSDVVVPAALQGNYEKELKKHTSKRPQAHVQSLENVSRKGPGSLNSHFLVVDEAHRLRNPGKTRQALLANHAGKRLALTGSLVYNHPSDMAGPVNFAAGSSVLPLAQNDFSEKYLRDRYTPPSLWGRITRQPGTHAMELDPERKEELKSILKKYVDYHPGSTENFPTREEQTVHVPMAENQRQIYDTLMNKAPKWVSHKVRENLPPTKSEAKQLNAFLSGVRQVTNTSRPYVSAQPYDEPKIDRAVSELRSHLDQNPHAKALVYSNYLDAGINPYKERLDKHKIPYGEFTGQMNKRKRDQLVKDYNDNKLKALLLSSAGGEGLDLKGTRLIQLLEPHWNEEKLKQVVGRGIRYKSHDHLPPEERKVLIQRYLATRPRSGLAEKLHLRHPGTSVDEYLNNMSTGKEQLNQQFRDLLHEEET